MKIQVSYVLCYKLLLIIYRPWLLLTSSNLYYVGNYIFKMAIHCEYPVLRSNFGWVHESHYFQITSPAKFHSYYTIIKNIMKNTYFSWLENSIYCIADHVTIILEIHVAQHLCSTQEHSCWICHIFSYSFSICVSCTLQYKNKTFILNPCMSKK